jgi:hypothetical protein
VASPRLLSHTEIETAQSCWARHAFAYTGHLTDGQTLKSRRIPRRLSEGRAWGAAAAVWHSRGDTLLASVEAVEALRASLDADELEMYERGVSLTPEERLGSENLLVEVFEHYADSVPSLSDLTRLEHEIRVAIPSRTGRRSSTHYGFQCFLDGWWVDPDGRPWLVEFKWRSRLTALELLEKSRQLRWYAWALRADRGIDPVGVIVDEVLCTPPQPARLVRSRRKAEGLEGMTVSHSADQLTLPESYLDACAHFGVEPVADTLEALAQRRWSQRVAILFRPSELEEAGQELVSAAKLIRDLDSGALYPMRHALPMLCNGCRFKPICSAPEDHLYVDTLFERRVPKREKEPA